MKRSITWYKLCLKIYAKKKITLLQILGIAGLLLLISFASVPDADNVTAGVVCEDDGYGEVITQLLLENHTVFEFVRYENREELEKDVVSGKLECGFILHEDLDKSLKKGELKGTITYVATPLATKGETMQELVFAQVMRVYSDEILKASDKEIYGDTDEERIKKLLERNHYYQNSDAVFGLEIVELDVAVSHDTQKEQASYPMQGTIGVIIFLIMLLAYGKKFETNGYSVQKAMDKGERFVYCCMNHLAAGTIPAVTGLGFILTLSGHRGVLKEIILMVLFLVLSAVFVTVVGNLMKKSTTYLAGTVSLLMINLLLCPVFMDWAVYVPAIGFLRLIFPLGIYLYF